MILPANSGGSWSDGILQQYAELDNFLSSRVGNLATLLIVGADGTDNELLVGYEGNRREAPNGPQAKHLTVDDRSPVPARQMESLDRGMIAMRRSTSEVYVGWRMLGTDPTRRGVQFVSFHRWRCGSDAQQHAALTQTTDYVDNDGQPCHSRMSILCGRLMLGVELAPSDTFILAG